MYCRTKDTIDAHDNKLLLRSVIRDVDANEIHKIENEIMNIRIAINLYQIENLMFL